MKSYLKVQDGRYYFRMWVPKILHPHLKREIIYPIRHLSLQTAMDRCRLLGVRLERLFQRAISGFFNMSVLHPYIRELCANILYVDECNTLSRASSDEFEMMEEKYDRAHRERDYSKAGPFLSVLGSHGIEINLESPDIQNSILNYYIGMKEVSRILKERASGNENNGYDAPDENGNMSSMLSREDQTDTTPLSMDMLKDKESLDYDKLLAYAELHTPIREGTSMEDRLSALNL